MNVRPRPVALGLGANLDDRRQSLRFAVRRLRDVVDELRTSRVYETRPVGVVEQPLFLNACCVGETRLSPMRLLAVCREIEVAAGRRPERRFGPRILDIDLLLYDDQLIERPGLCVPHPRLRERAFVLVPLTEVAPDWPVPSSERGMTTVAELRERIEVRGIRPTDIELM